MKKKKTYRVIRKIKKNGKMYKPGDSITLTFDEAKELYSCIDFKNSKTFLSIMKEREEQMVEERNIDIRRRARNLGVDEDEVERYLSEHDRVLLRRSRR
ncbi:MAG: hypothetical protein ABEK36_03950 [Candidatus Aenigmatarchaeota archaeon]